jgi:hypothetical protein
MATMASRTQDCGGAAEIEIERQPSDLLHRVACSHAEAVSMGFKSRTCLRFEGDGMAPRNSEGRR